MIIDTTLSTTQIQQRYGLSRTTAWRAKQRGWAVGSVYHRRTATPGGAELITLDMWQQLYRYVRHTLPECGIHNAEDIASNAILLAINRGLQPGTNVAAILTATARSLMYSFQKQGLRSLALAVENWDYNNQES